MKQSQNNNIEALFRKLLGKVEEQPSNDIWSKIETQLPKNQLFSSFTKGVIGFGILIFCSFSIYQISKVDSHKIKVNKLAIEKQNLIAIEGKKVAEIQKEKNNKKGLLATKNEVSFNETHFNKTELLQEKSNIEIDILSKIQDNNVQSTESVIVPAEQKVVLEGLDLAINPSEFLITKNNIASRLEDKTNIENAINELKFETNDYELDQIPISNFKPEINLVSENEVFNLDIENNCINPTQILETKASKINSEKEEIVLKSMWSAKEELMQKSAGIDEVDPLTLRRLKNKVNFDRVNINKGFYVGPFAGVNYTWLSVSKKYQDKEYRVENVKYKLSFGETFGIGLGYDFSKHWGVATDFGMSSINQTYFERPSENVLNKRSVSLNYWQLPVYVRYKANIGNRLQHRPITVGGLIGPQFSFLKSKRTTENGFEKEINQRINESEFGIAGIVNADFYINKNLFLTLGVKGSFGTNLNGFPKLQGDDNKEPISYQFGFFTRFNFKVAPKH
jgi:outer membrane protein W